MSTLTHAPDRAGSRHKSGPRPRGLVWLMLRQHRVMLLMVTALTVLGALWIVYQRGVALDAVHAAGWPEKPAAELSQRVLTPIQDRIGTMGFALSMLPIVLGVFCGAPLIAADQEQGTAQLVTTQSVPRRRWLAHKLGIGLIVALAPTVVLGFLHLWWWRAVSPFGDRNWLQGSVFDNTGPMLAALTLLTVVAGITIGLLARRVLLAMVVTFVFAVVSQLAWTWVPAMLATPHRASYPLNGDYPSGLTTAVEVDNWVSTASGELFGFGTCIEEKKYEACLADKGIVNRTIEYFSYDQMAVMQWTGAGILTAVSVSLIAFVVVRVGRRPL
ncbi:ABC transporter permease [Streptomyces jumonjinensis]|uniref:ABC transporter permease n=1 Tax=Streptomyces jumonjinensis TaxID=1945 RepID=A0A646KM40_STRJU|nr:ABC transporter permease [Streptomyces jumonjinensis]MQT03285.1 ABC transporter permease [Streptomyces jumonjinensis]